MITGGLKLFFLALDSSNDGARVFHTAEFAQVDSLPGTGGEAAVADRNVQRDADQTALDMAGHVVRALGVVDVMIALGHNTLERGLHVLADIWVAILVEGQSRRRVLQKQVQHANFVLLDLGNILKHLVGHEIASRAPGAESK
jgi:hypothetical protein